VVQPHFAASPRGLALARRLVGERSRIDEGDPVMLVIVADERDLLVLVQQLRPEHGAVPLDHRFAAIGLQHEMRQLFG
jgi:hypothetical protein